MWIKVYDGATTIGGNKIYVGNGKHGLFLDFGLNFEKSGMYFREYIKGRASRGINDYLELGLLPRIDVYRGDLQPHDVDRNAFERLPVDGVLLTHAHMDHYGMIGNLDFKIPVIASPETLAILKSTQDSGKADAACSIIYDSRREEVGGDVPILKSTGVKIRRDRTKIERNLMLRPIIPTQTLNTKAIDFLYYQSTSEREAYLREKLKIGTLDELPFKVRAYAVDHSIYGSVGYIIHEEKDDLKIAYTGDIRLHGERRENTQEFINASAGSDVLIIEGTRLSDEHEHNYTTEREVFENCSEAVGGARGLVIADFSARNFERLAMFANIAEQNGRNLVITEKDAYVLSSLLAAGTEINIKNILIYKKPAETIGWWQKLTRNCNMWDGHYVSAVDIRKEPAHYVLAFSLYDMPNLIDIKARGGVYIYSATEAFSEDMKLDFGILANWLQKFELASVGFSIDSSGNLQFKRGYHASGHASPEELEYIIDRVDPEIIIPIHTQHPEWFSKKYGKIATVLKNGQKKEI